MMAGALCGTSTVHSWIFIPLALEASGVNEQVFALSAHMG